MKKLVGGGNMAKARVLIRVCGGVAEFSTLGNVEVALIDEDNIDAGDAAVVLEEEWKPLVDCRFDNRNKRYVLIRAGSR